MWDFFSFLPKVDFYWGTKTKRFTGNEQMFMILSLICFHDQSDWYKALFFILKQFIEIFFLLQAQAAEETSPDIGNGDGSVAPWVGFMHSLLFHIFFCHFL